MGIKIQNKPKCLITAAISKNLQTLFMVKNHVLLDFGS